MNLRISSLLAGALVLGASHSSALAQSSTDVHWSGHWPQWRGPSGIGVSVDADPPTEWSETENVRWKTRIPERGHGTPIVWSSRVFLTAAIATGEKFVPRPSGRPDAHEDVPVDSAHQFVVMAIDRTDGNIFLRGDSHLFCLSHDE